MASDRRPTVREQVPGADDGSAADEGRRRGGRHGRLHSGSKTASRGPVRRVQHGPHSRTGTGHPLVRPHHAPRRPHPGRRGVRPRRTRGTPGRRTGARGRRRRTGAATRAGDGRHDARGVGRAPTMPWPRCTRIIRAWSCSRDRRRSPTSGRHCARARGPGRGGARPPAVARAGDPAAVPRGHGAVGVARAAAGRDDAARRSPARRRSRRRARASMPVLGGPDKS